MATHFRKLSAISVLLLIGCGRGWAGSGDIDPSFGSGGRLEPLGEVSLVLPDDRLVRAYYAGNLVVARLDANGRVDPGFGEGGETRVPLPGAWPRFEPGFVSAAPDGGLVFAGPLRDYALDTFQEAVLRLDRDGRVVTSFGGHGDGYYRLTDGPVDSFGLLQTRLAAIAVDANGRILLAERTWTADGLCSGPTGVRRLTSSGTPDATFGSSGRIEVPGVDSCHGPALFGVRNDGRIVLGARRAIVGLDANGALDPTFGVGGHVSHAFADDWGRTVLLPDGSIMIVERNSSATGANVVLSKLDRDGQLDATFGADAGSVQLEFGAAFFGLADSHESVDEFVLAPHAEQVYLKLAVQHADGTTACSGGIARFFLDGTPDLDFGRQGLTCLDYGAFSFSLIAAQRNGSPLFGTQHGVFRLLTDESPSPGLFTIALERVHKFRKVDGIVTVPVMRTAGRDGAVSVNFATGQAPITRYSCGHNVCVTAAATPGSDFEAESGQLHWADGEESDREITVTIFNDEIVDSPDERFRVELSNPEGGVLDFGQFVDIGILDDDVAAAPSPPPTNPPASPSTGGGGGSLAWATLIVLSGLLLRRREIK